MKIYAAHGVTDFVICLGYMGFLIKEYFANYFLHMSDVTFDIARNEMQVHQQSAEPWKVTLVDTGDHTMTAVNREVPVALRLPAEHWPPAAALADLAAPVDRSLRRTGRCL